MKLLRASTLSIVILMGVGCCATTDVIRADYTAADRATYDVIAPRYLNYIAGDDSLDEDTKKTQSRTVTTWRLRLENAEKPVLPADGEGE